MRAFLALELSPRLKGELGRLVERLRGAQADVKWVEEANLHLTLHFLGEVREEDLPPLKGIMEEAAARVAPFELCLKGTGAFPNPDRAKVIWAGLEAGPELHELYRLLAGGLSRGGWSVEPRPYSPHITLGRVRSPRNHLPLAEALQKEFGKNWGRCQVERVLLMESKLSPRGPSYTPLATANLSSKI